MHGERVDGNDLLAVREATARLLARAREERKPALLETVTYRFRGHSVADAGKVYRTAEEIESWQRARPDHAVRAGWPPSAACWPTATSRTLRARSNDVVRPGHREAAWPRRSPTRLACTSNVYGDPAPPSSSAACALARPVRRAGGDDVVADVTYREALRRALDEELVRDERVFLMGEEIGRFEGSYKVTAGLWKKYGPKRVRETPISEEGFVGAGIGAAMLGLRPVVEIMTINFILVAMDMVVNHAAKVRYDVRRQGAACRWSSARPAAPARS